LKPAFHIAGVIEKAPCPIHISPFRAERIVFHTDGLLHVYPVRKPRCLQRGWIYNSFYHDQILVERGECRFCVVVSNTGLFSAVEMIDVELNGLFGLLDLPVGNVFQGLEILQKSPERLCCISILQAFWEGEISVGPIGVESYAFFRHRYCWKSDTITKG